MKTPCRYAGCSNLLDKGGYCEKHASSRPDPRKDYDRGSRRNNPELAASADFRSSYRWGKVRRMKLSINPLCEDPYGQHARRQVTETAKQVHHIIGLALCAKDERAYTMDNLMSVCTKCHAQLERDERKKES